MMGLDGPIGPACCLLPAGRRHPRPRPARWLHVARSALQTLKWRRGSAVPEGAAQGGPHG